MSYRPLESCGPSSYVLLTGSPSASTCTTFGLTPKELRYLQVHNAPAISIQLPVVKKAHKSQEMEICQNSTEWRKSLNSKANSSIFREFWDCKIGIGYFIPLIRI